ncbi:MAG: hypothetical protein M1829_004973 [Trizodia sp. TS-e1964]|nr:MAG: hypothetical protein M1829_004973 [Trizodia sp. TS-e1964]
MPLATIRGTEISDLEGSLQTQSLDLKLQRCFGKTDKIFAREDSRLLRLRLLSLENENSDLHELLAKDSDVVSKLANAKASMKEKIEAMELKRKQEQMELRASMREIEILRAESKSKHDLSTESAKLLTENLALTRELSNLRPEVNHLKAQASSYQTILSEKLALQRELSTALVELESEKRASQRAIAREGKNSEREGQLEGQLDALKNELGRLKRLREGSEREFQKREDEMEKQKGVLESKLEAMKGKLRALTSQLQETQSELRKVTAAVERDGLAKKSRQRPISQQDGDDIFGTPDGIIARGKRHRESKGARGSALPGDKSTFSITPFLNRTASIVVESSPKNPEIRERGGGDGMEEPNPPSDPSSNNSSIEPEAELNPQKAAVKRSQAPKLSSQNPPKALKRLATSKDNTKTTRPRKRAAGSTLEQVAEEENSENDWPADDSEMLPASKPTTSLPSEVEPKKKKRKLLGAASAKTLFDDDDGDTKAHTKSSIMVSKGLQALGRVKLAPKAGLRGGLAGSASGLVAFSPLKKERKTLSFVQ